jgi:hypothetical protein
MNSDRPLAKGEPRERDAGRDPVSGTSGPAGRTSAGTTIDSAAEDAYWRENYASRPYIDGAYGYDDYGPAYRYAADSYAKHRDRGFDEAESDLSAGWERAKSGSRLTWEHAKHAVRDAWNRLTHAADREVPGDSDRYLA